MVTPKRKIEKMLYLANRANYRLNNHDSPGAQKDCLSIEKVAARFGPVDVKDFACLAVNYIKHDDLLSSKVVIHDIQDQLLKLLY